MSIPMVIRVKGLFRLTEENAADVRAMVEAEYKRCSEAGLPMVVGPGCEVVWPVEMWEHHFEVMGTLDEIREETALLEADGWQVCGVAPSLSGDRLLVFKRPARTEPTEPA
jgi:hypothetical protein